MPFTVFIDDNFWPTVESKREEYGEFEAYEAALAAAKAIVDRSLAWEYRPGMTVEELYSRYKSVGEDPFIKPCPDDQERFSAWDYAKKRCEEICTSPPPAAPAP